MHYRRLSREYQAETGKRFSLKTLSGRLCSGRKVLMICRDLRDLLHLLETEGELHSVRVTVDPLLEIAAITDRVCKSEDNKALLFEDVRGSRFRVATNVFGSEKRMALALGIDRLSDLTSRFDGILGELPGKNSVEKISSLTESGHWRSSG